MTPELPVLILGCGFTGRRVAASLLETGRSVLAASRSPKALEPLAQRGAGVLEFDAASGASLERLAAQLPEALVLVHSLPVLKNGDEPTAAVLRSMGGKLRRVVYISTTGVYGAVHHVDEHSLAQPRTPRERLRFDAEQLLQLGDWSTLVLRPAAIYGPGRGVHEAMRRNGYPLVGDGRNFVSRIHVDDLAAHVVAGVDSPVTGAWPVADDEPCTSREIAEFCAELLGVPMSVSVGADAVSETRRANRRVDGRAIRRELGIGLNYPSYRTGIPASLQV